MEFRPLPERYARTGAFGRTHAKPWSGPDDPRPERRAALVQDQVARFVRAHLARESISQTEFAKRIGMDRPKLNRLLNGTMWASLTDIESLLGECGATLTSIALAVGDGSHQSPRVKKIIASFLEEALAKVQEEIARTGPEHPSTEAPRLTGGPA